MLHVKKTQAKILSVKQIETVRVLIEFRPCQSLFILTPSPSKWDSPGLSSPGLYRHAIGTL